MPAAMTHLAPSGSPAKVDDGPTTGPSPGPTLATAVAAEEIAVTMSSPMKPSAAAMPAKVRMNRKKNTCTDSATSSVSGLPL